MVLTKCEFKWQITRIKTNIHVTPDDDNIELSVLCSSPLKTSDLCWLQLGAYAVTLPVSYFI